MDSSDVRGSAMSADQLVTFANTSCNICGGTRFIPGPFRRMARNGSPPKCAECGSLERHRVVRQVYDAIPTEELNSTHALQFSNDSAAPKERFQSFEVSQFGGDNSLDMTHIDRKNGSYEWVIANHVLEHVDNDHSAIQELLRILSDDGTIQLTVPTPSTALETWEIAGTGLNCHQHRHGYGSDLPLRFAAELSSCFGLQIVCQDVPTDRWDVVYLFFKSRQKMLNIGNALLKSGLPTLRCV
jgi:SAM-dependent methyltransferase